MQGISIAGRSSGRFVAHDPSSPILKRTFPNVLARASRNSSRPSIILLQMPSYDLYLRRIALAEVAAHRAHRKVPSPTDELHRPRDLDWSSSGPVESRIRANSKPNVAQEQCRPSPRQGPEDARELFKQVLSGLLVGKPCKLPWKP